MKLGVIDIGTNSVRLLIAEKNSSPISNKSYLTTTRLGKGLMASGCLSEEAINRTIDALKRFSSYCNTENVHEVQLIATSAVREANNRDFFVNRVKDEVGWKVRVISGEEEASLGYLGVVKGLPEVSDNSLVIDIGGGSTELIWTSQGEVNYTSSRTGAVRMTEQNSSKEDIYRILEPVLNNIKKAGLNAAVGIGGTVTTLAAVDQALESYSLEKVHGYELSLTSIERIYRELSNLDLEERRKVKGLQPERADIILAGMDILQVILSELGFSKVVVSETDIMYGLAYKFFKENV